MPEPEFAKPYYFCKFPQLTSAKEIVEQMLDRMTEPESSVSIPLESGNTVALMINNLGGLSMMEMYLVAGEVIKNLGEGHYNPIPAPPIPQP